VGWGLGVLLGDEDNSDDDSDEECSDWLSSGGGMSRTRSDEGLGALVGRRSRLPGVTEADSSTGENKAVGTSSESASQNKSEQQYLYIQVLTASARAWCSQQSLVRRGWVSPRSS
jgi:hypothetical protein